MALKQKFKWYAGVVKDAAVNFGDTMVSGQKAYGCNQAGIPGMADEQLKASAARIVARKAARKASKP